jgi:hypothetical protein
MPIPVSRRALLAAAPAAFLARAAGVPRVDYHAHLAEGVPWEKGIADALDLSRRRGVKFGILEHAGAKTNPSSERIATDADLRRWIAALEGKPCFKGLQAEGLDWMKCFSKDAVAQLDYVLSDALTFPEKDGRLVQLWRPGAEIPADARQDFMERYTDFHVKVMAAEPIDILANPLYLPDPLQPDYDALWTPDRMRRVIDAAIRYGVAIEINSRYRIPRLPFLRLAQKAGVRFSFGSNAHGADAGKIEYCLEMAEAIGLERRRFFTPTPAGRKPILWRKFS